MIKKFWFIFLVLLIEGSSLMAVELIGAKLLAPFFGSSLYVWTAVLGITVLGLTLGYAFGGQMARKQTNEKQLILILGLAAILVFVLPATASAVISLTSGMGLITGVCIATFLLIVPPVFLFGLIGPLAVHLMAEKMETLGNVAGTVYFTSTLGGIAATFLFGFYWIPEVGLRFSLTVTAIALVLLPVIFLVKKFVPVNEKEILPTDTIPIRDQKPQTRNKKQITRKPQAGRQKIKNTVYLFAMLEGATVMAVELMSARMLAPYFGSSLYVWGAVIGITLLSLAMGYFAGGRLADRYPDVTSIHWALLISAFFLLFMHYFASSLTLAFNAMNMRMAVVLVSFLLILPPLFFLGMVPTLLIRYVTAEIDDAGTTTGRVFTISSASGILFLPILGFFIIPNFGLTGPSLLLGFLVGIVPMISLLSRKKYVSLIFLPVLLISYVQRDKATSSPNLAVKYYSEGLLGQVLVADVYKNGAGQATNDRILFVNRMGQTNVNNNSHVSNWNYITFGMALSSKLPENSKALLLGLGGGSVANMLQSNLKFDVDAVELDERIAMVAKKYFALNPGVSILVDDARHYLETTSEKYDLIFFDVFKGDIPPPHVLSLECFQKAKSLLNPNGLIIVNFNGFLNGEIGKPGRSVFATLNAAGLETKLLPTPGLEADRNIIFVASAEPQIYQNLRSPLLFKGQPVNIDTLFLDTSTLKQEDAVVLKDDRPNLERLNLLASDEWRKGYNGTYTKFFLENGVPLFY